MVEPGKPPSSKSLHGSVVRLEAARQVLGDDYQIAITLRDMSDIEMFRIMGLENSEDWMNPVQHTEQVIKQGRAFFDDWLERFPQWDDFVQGVESNPLAEFGPRRETALQQVTEWLGGAAEAAHNYANIVKYGVEEDTLHRFTASPRPRDQRHGMVLGYGRPHGIPAPTGPTLGPKPLTPRGK